MEQAGLQTSVDPVGNLIGTLPGQGEIICIGSHIDTVPGGGIYDGTYGVLSGIECVQRLKELGYQNRHPIQVIAFTEEEGNVIGGTFGSKAFTGGEIDEAMRPNLALHGLTMEQVSDIENRLDINAGWTKSEDGYYYYNEILSNKTGAINSSKVFSKVTIPTEWGNEIAGITFNINVKAEFIQSDNFTPVTDEAGNITGWGNVAIEKSLK